MFKRSKLALYALLASLALAVVVSGGCGGGSGGTGAAREISTAAELAAIRGDLTGSYVLTADIDLTEYIAENEWTPIGSFVPLSTETGNPEDEETAIESYAFTGSFDGGGYTISGLRYSSSDAETYGVGLFGCITGGASVTNLNVEDAEVSSSAVYAGCVIGVALGGSEVSDVTLKDGAASGMKMVGGVLGGAQECELRNITAENVAVTMSGAEYAQGAGIIVGGSELSPLYNCRAAGGSVTATDKYAYSVGAMAGCAMETTAVENCSASDITVTVGENAFLVGGLLGHAGNYYYVDSAMEITGCDVTDVTIIAPASAERIGMITGGGFYMNEYAIYYPEPTAFAIGDSAATGTISGGTKAVGAAAGYIYNNSTVDDATCDVSGVNVNGTSGSPLYTDLNDYQLNDLI